MMHEVPLGKDGKKGVGATPAETLTRTNDDNYESSDEDVASSERWAPLGSSSPVPFHNSEQAVSTNVELERLKQLEDEQEQLNTSLLALTSHFAQVQFRLQQICRAGTTEKESLLQELTEFASRGCPDFFEAKKMRAKPSSSKDAPDLTEAEHEACIERQRLKQLQLISQLKDQLEDLEKFAYESGEGGLPSSQVIAKQRIIIESLRNRMDLEVDQMEKFSEEDLQKQVDQAVNKLINPVKLKDQVVDQLKTQIEDLHRFIEFLQGSEGKAECTCLKEGDGGDGTKPVCLIHHASLSRVRAGAQKGFGLSYQSERKRADSVLNETLSLLQLYVLSQLGCQSKQFKKNELKKTTKGNHWGDLRAALEVAVDKVAAAAAKDQQTRGPAPATLQPEADSDSDEYDEVFTGCSEELVTAVRKDLCSSLRDLLQHGMIQPGMLASGKGMAFGCLPNRSSQQPNAEEAVHAWDIILKYYEMKHGRDYNEAPVRKLTQSFNLDTIGGKAITSKQLLLSSVDTVMSTHSKLKRSSDAQFKAFVCAALNQRKLAAWLRMILKTREIVDENYFPWSYVARTGFDDGLRCIEKLNAFTFNLPVDLAVRPFNHMKDAF